MDLEGFFPDLKIAQNITLLKRNANERLSFFRRIITLFSFSLSKRDLLSIVSLLALKTILLKLQGYSTCYWPKVEELSSLQENMIYQVTFWKDGNWEVSVSFFFSLS